MEHRCGERLRLNRIVPVTATGNWNVMARLRDLSVSGAFLECSKPPQRVTWLRVELGHRTRSIVVVGDVIRRTEEGFGVEWQEFAPFAVKQVLASLQRKRRAATSPTEKPAPSTRASAARPRTIRR
jgi:hypothetical protein